MEGYCCILATNIGIYVFVCVCVQERFDIYFWKASIVCVILCVWVCKKGLMSYQCLASIAADVCVCV